MMFEVALAACSAAQPQPLWRRHIAVGLRFAVTVIGDASAVGGNQQHSSLNSKIQRSAVNGIVWADARDAVSAVRT